jgi:hypothetical protein
MSQENVEVVQRTIEAWNRRDLDDALCLPGETGSRC